MPRFEQAVNRREFVRTVSAGPAMLESLGANDAITSRGIFQQAQIARAVELKPGAPGPDAIEIVTRDGESRACADTLRAILAQG